MKSDELWELAAAGESLASQRVAIAEALRAEGLRAEVIGVVDRGMAPGALLRPRRGGTSRAGGGVPPLVDANWVWPQAESGRLAFLAEVRLDDLLGLDSLELPIGSGSLLFFHDETPGLDDLLLASTHVAFVPPDADIVPADGTGEFQPEGTCPLGGVAVPLAGLNDDLLDRLDDLQGGDAYSSINEVLAYQGQGWRFLGAADSEPGIEDRIRWWFESPESAPDRGRFSSQERAGVGWRCLLQLRELTDETSGLHMAWGDGGSLTFCIPEPDLAAWRFDRVISYVGAR